MSSLGTDAEIATILFEARVRTVRNHIEFLMEDAGSRECVSIYDVRGTHKYGKSRLLTPARPVVSSMGLLVRRFLLILRFVLTQITLVQIYDYCLTLGPEVSLIWPSQMSTTKILYLLTRYMAFVDINIVIYCECQIRANRAP